MELTQQQNIVFEKIKAFMNSDASVFILRGYAGTGKTTMIKIISEYLAHIRPVYLMAPTGRAARVLSEKTGHIACTIHKSIYDTAHIVTKIVKDIADSEVKFIFPLIKTDKKIVAIVDESSMVCSRKIEHELFVFGTDNLLDDLMEFVRPSFGGKIIFVGDPAQLPPVGESESNALNSAYFKEKGLKVMEVELTEILRQKGDSVILKNAMMIRDLLKQKKRNRLVFEEKKDDVESVPSSEFLKKYLDYRKQSKKHDSVVVCYSNKAANTYNRDIRTSIFGGDVPLRVNDILLVTQNNYMIDRMNGELILVLEVGARIQQSAPVFVQVGSERKRIVFTINFVQVTVTDGNNKPVQCMLIDDLLTNDRASLTIDESRALYINFCMRNPRLKQGTEEFAQKLKSDLFYNAIRAKYGYAVTGHKCQGGEWGKVFVDYSGRTGLNDDCLRWAYTATTRAQKTLYVTNLPHITPFDKFRIEAIQKCRNMDSECRVIGDVDETPFHDSYKDNFLKAKYNCIVCNMEGTPYKVLSVNSKPYLEVYQIQTPNGVNRFDIRYKTGGVFLPAKPISRNEHTVLVSMLLNDERMMPFICNYVPSDESYGKLYNLIRSSCDSLSIQITNVVEHTEDYSVIFYMRTSGTFSYIKVYVNCNGFITYAKPMSLLGSDDRELEALINDLKEHMI